MDIIDREEAGWLVALAWLSALEETARDFHGTRPRVFSERAYEHSVQYYLHLLGDEYGMQINEVGLDPARRRELHPDRDRRRAVPRREPFRGRRGQPVPRQHHRP